MLKTLDEIPTLSEELYNSISSTIENIAFLSLGEAEKDGVENIKGEFINGSILIKTDPAIYSMEFLFPQELLESISNDVKVPGTISESAGNIVIDILLELVNTIAGNLLRTMEEFVGTFTLDIPEFEIGKPLSRDAFVLKNYTVEDEYQIVAAITMI